MKRILLSILVLGIPLLSACGAPTTETETPSVPETEQPTVTAYSLSITISPSGAGSVSPSDGQHEEGTRVTLTATPASGYTFDYWNGDASGSSATITLTMDSNKNIIAHFSIIDIALPVISEVNASKITESSTTIAWITDEPATSQIEYGKTTDYGLTTTLDEELVINHSVSLSGLETNTTYHFRVKSKDKARNEGLSRDYVFTTSEPEPVQKQFGGVISRNSVLTVENSPFLLTSNVLVPKDVSLYIEPGVTIDLNDKFIQVDGTLQARGEPGNPIQFLSSVGSQEGNRIYFTTESTCWNQEQESGCIIEYVNMRVHNSGYGVHGPIEIRGASPRIANNSILNLSSLGSAILVSECSPVIEGNTLEADQIGLQIEHSEAHIIGNVIKGAARGLIIRGEFRCQVKQNLIRDNGTGIQLRYLPFHRSYSTVRGTLTENTIVSNYYHGIRIEEISDLNIALPTIRSNSIHDNGEYNIYLESTSVDLDLTSNWWGTTALNIIEKGFYHQPQDFRLGRILYKPFLTEPPNEAPNIEAAP